MAFHIKKHQDKSCVHCTFVTNNSHTLSLHMKVTHKQKKTHLFKCDKCPYTSVYENVMTAHQSIHTNQKFSCEKCGYKTSVEVNLEEHKKSHKIEKRSANKILTDKIDKMMFMTGRSLLVGRETRLEFCCKICRKKGIADNVFIHIKESHTGNNTGKALPCKLCEKKERSQYAMRMHCANMHFGKMH